MSNNICRLTGRTGSFVRCHLIPSALTRVGEPGQPLAQFGSGRRPARRWASWYDDRLVIREGEEIFTDLDTFAISTFRTHKLIWSSWGRATTVPAKLSLLPPVGAVRSIRGINGPRLRLFLLSLLWRAAMTDRPEFSEVSIPEQDVQAVGRMVVEGTASPLDYYSASLIQITTRGPSQNLTRLADAKVIPNQPGLGHQTVPMFRFYFDGLIAHIHKAPLGDLALTPSMVGASNNLIVNTVPYERSFQSANLRAVLANSRPS